VCTRRWEVHKDLAAVHVKLDAGAEASAPTTHAAVPVLPPTSCVPSVTSTANNGPPIEEAVRSPQDVSFEQYRASLRTLEELQQQVTVGSGIAGKSRPLPSQGEPPTNPILESERKQMQARLEGFKDAMRLMDDKLTRLDLNAFAKGSEEKARHPSSAISRGEESATASSRGTISWGASRCCSATPSRPEQLFSSRPEQLVEAQAAGPNRFDQTGNAGALS